MANTYREAALILRRLKERVDALEQGNDQTDIANVVRSVGDVSTSHDDAYAIIDANPGWVWGESRYDYDEWQPRSPTATAAVSINDTRSQPAVLDSATLTGYTSTEGALPQATFGGTTYDDESYVYG